MSENNAPKIGIIDWLVLPVFHLFFLPQFIIWDVAQRVTISLSRELFFGVSSLLQYSYFQTLKIPGTKFTITGQDKIPFNKPLIVVSNHQSLFDIPVLSTIFSRKRPRFVAKKELARGIPTASFNLRRYGHAIIDRKNSKQALQEITRVAKLVEEENSAIIIFPEGTRARDGELKKFKPNGVKTLVEKIPNAYIVPVAINGTWKLSLHKCLPIPFGCKVNVEVLDCISCKEIEDQDTLATDLQTIIKSSLENSLLHSEERESGKSRKKG